MYDRQATTLCMTDRQHHKYNIDKPPHMTDIRHIYDVHTSLFCSKMELTEISIVLIGMLTVFLVMLLICIFDCVISIIESRTSLLS